MSKQEKAEEKEVSIPETELNALKEELQDFKNKYLRALAESENMRKRLQKEREELIQYAMENLINEFLPPIDHFENALSFSDQMSDEVKKWAVGFQMILTQFKDVLATNGVKAMETVGKHFDPHEHEAIEMISTTEFPPGTIVEECLKGYKIGKRTIRPAKVKVAQNPEAEKTPEEEKDLENEGE